ncbi:MAG TPA: PGPGW domain-containing protein [Thermoanaerobaculia bacterium]|nr:PGPGW domain-containing protein [Thermoanaerobaculia bacterium]
MSGAHRPRRQRHPAAHLPRGWRIFFIVSGWVLLVFGIALLPLPGPGALVIGFGAALLSLASESAYWALRWAFQRWPRGWRRLERARRTIFRKIVGPNAAP